MANSSKTGPRGNAPGPGPIPTPEELKQLQRKSDRSMAIVLFALGIVGTIMNMNAATEQAFVNNAAEIFRMNNLGEYHRPEGLDVLSWAGIIGHPLNYAIWLYIALRRYKAGKRVVWCAFTGAIIAIVFGGMLSSGAHALHPEIWDFVFQSAVPTPAP